ncbi:hypothetical protein FIBSPDRAFT_470617 [Athelia psychrophila]|uniref:Uncharacterized protein n=1 Tax=Athelia psychrophila TaxID=1759441 RepID=A0A167U130_9AGAM|nr:hypothetical protein FIBSPDRAFT_470617 [Fibularhizoctonia sp. CBS 109695]
MPPTSANSNTSLGSTVSQRLWVVMAVYGAVLLTDTMAPPWALQAYRRPTYPSSRPNSNSTSHRTNANQNLHSSSSSPVARITEGPRTPKRGCGADALTNTPSSAAPCPRSRSALRIPVTHGQARKHRHRDLVTALSRFTSPVPWGHSRAVEIPSPEARKGWRRRRLTRHAAVLRMPAASIREGSGARG